MDSTFYDCYKHPYSLLPNLRKIANESVFLRPEDVERCIREKQRSLSSQHCNCSLGVLPQGLWRDVGGFIRIHHPRDLERYESLHGISVNIQEDLCIHKINGPHDYLMAAHVCFPGGWNPQEALGKSFDQIHSVIPGMDLRASRKQVELMVNKGPFERFVWGVVYDEELNRHSDRRDLAEFRPESPSFKIRIERQVTVPFPKHQCCLFVLRHYHVDMSDVDYAKLHETLTGMTEEQRDYKGITGEFLKYLLEDSSKNVTN